MKKRWLHKFLAKWLPAIFWSVLVFVLSSLPGADFSENPGSDFAVRKILHVLEYMVLMLTYYRGSKDIGFSVLACIIFAFTDEAHQTFIPTRTGKVSDVLIDSFAVSAMGIILWKYYQNLPRKLKKWLEE